MQAFGERTSGHDPPRVAGQCFPASYLSQLLKLHQQVLLQSPYDTTTILTFINGKQFYLPASYSVFVDACSVENLLKPEAQN